MSATSTTTRLRDRDGPAALAMRGSAKNVFHARPLVRNRVYNLERRLWLIDDFRSQRFVTLVLVPRPVVRSLPIPASSAAPLPAGFIFFSEDAHRVLVIDNSHAAVVVVVDVVVLLLPALLVPLTRGRYYSRILLQVTLPRVQSTILASHLIAPAFVLSFLAGESVVPARLTSAI